MKITIKTILFMLCTVIFFVTGGVAHGDDLFSEMMVVKPEVRVKAPAFTLTDSNGKARSLEEFTGKIILLNFWATWCVPCREEMPGMERLWKSLSKEKFVILAISVDKGSKKRVEEFCKKQGITFPVLLDRKGKVRNEYEVTALPMSYIIGKDGKITGKVIGARKWDGAKAVRLFKNLID